MSDIFLIDNFDSFTYNIVHGLVLAGSKVTVIRSDQVDLNWMYNNKPDLLVISPGPGSPKDAKTSMKAIKLFAGIIPIFGICLGMQCLALSYGGLVEPGLEPMHGKVSRIRHNGHGVFCNLPDEILVARYHSLHVKQVPNCFDVIATSDDGIPMAIRHRQFHMTGLQFHPDSFLTNYGSIILKHVSQRNF